MAVWFDEFVYIIFVKGQIISECPYEKIVYPKIARNIMAILGQTIIS